MAIRPRHLPCALVGWQMQLLLAGAEQQPGLLPEDADRLRAGSADAADPADRSRRR
jgi:hypothetical protein